MDFDAGSNYRRVLAGLGGNNDWDPNTGWSTGGITAQVSAAPWKEPEQLVSEPASAAEAGEMHQPIHGQVIPVFRGAVRGGRVFWFTGPENRNVSAYANFAVAIARNEWQKPGVLLTVRADDTLIYDARRGGRTRGRFTLRIYDGIENDFEPVMLAENGVAETPAYHGLIYLFFDDFRCDEFGFRIPVISAEWSDTTAASEIVGTIPLLGSSDNGYSHDANTKLCYDVVLNRFINYYTKDDDPGGIYLGITDFSSNSETSLAKVTNLPDASIDVVYGACTIRGTSLIICVSSDSPETNNWDLLIDAETGVVLASSEDGIDEEVEWWSSLQFEAGPESAFIVAGRIAQTSSPKNMQVAFAKVNVSDPEIEYLQYGTDEVGAGGSPIISSGRNDANGTIFYASSGGVVYEALFTELAAPTWREIYDAGTTISGFRWVGGEHTIRGVRVPYGSLIISTVAGAVRTVRRVDDDTGDLDWTITEGLGNATGGYTVIPRGGAWYSVTEGMGTTTTHRLQPGYALLRDIGDGVVGETLSLLDVTDGSLTDLGDVSGDAADHYDQYTGNSYKLLPDEWEYTSSARYEPGEITIEEILTDFSTYDGLLTEAQLEFIGLDGLTCHGAYIDRDTDLRHSVAKINELYGIDKVETGTGVKFIKKTTGDLFDPDVEIAEVDLVEARSGDITTIIQSRRKSETEIPQEVELQYRNVDADYNVSNVSASRPTGVFQSTQSTLRKTLDVPLVLTEQKAANLAMPLLYRHVTGQVAHAFTLSRRHLAVEPSDVLEVTADGYVRLLKTIRAVKRADHCQDITAEEYLSTADVTVIAPVTILQTATVLGEGHARYIHLDTALLRYSHDVGGAGIVSYAILTSRGQDDWPGASLWRRRAGGEWDSPYVVGSPAPTVCVAQAALPAPPVTFETDLENTLTVRLLTGDGLDIADVTYLEMMNGANRAMLGRPGRWMMLAYQNVTAGSPSDGTFTLDTFMQGLKGTEVFQGTSLPGDWFIPLRPELFGAVRYEIADLDDAIQYKARGRGVDFDDVPIDSHVVSGAAETPYAPGSLEAIIDGADIDLSWIRRTRLMWEWYDEGSAVEGPLGETVELYKVDILDGPGGAVLRTYLNEPLEAKTYVAAHIATDFGSMPDVLTFTVQQWSAVVGWGYVAEVTVPLV